MNELLFLFHLLLCIAISYAAKKLGRDCLLAWIVLQPVLANLFVLKEILLFGFTVTCSDVYAVSALLGINFLQEYYGKKDAQKAVTLSFLAMVFFIAMSSMHLLYTPSVLDHTHAAYNTILSQAPRLVLASVITFFLVQQFDLRFFSLLKKRFTSLSYRARNCISLTISQLIDTFLFTLLGLSGLLSNLVEIFLISFVIKSVIGCTLALFSSPKLALKT